MATSKKRGKNRSGKADGGTVPQDVETIIIDGDDPDISLDDASISLPTADGTVTVNLNPEVLAPKQSKSFADNLAEYMADYELVGLSSQLLDGIDEDARGRQEWLQQRADGLDQLALKIIRPGMGNVGASATAVAGQSTVRDPIMLEAVLRGQANAYAEMCPSGGPCKAVNFGDETEENDQLAEELEKDFNYFFTTTASEYYPDYNDMLGMTVYASGMFRKVYRDPIKERPVSISVDGSNLILSTNVTDLKNAGRITEVIMMRPSVMRRMQMLGEYRDISLSTPNPEPNVLAMKEASLSGLEAKPQRPEDQDYTVYETYVELDLKGFEHKKGGKPTGLPLPYKITLDKDSRTILAIRRNWREEDTKQIAKIPFVAFPYVRAPGTGIYGAGMLHILGNITMALTAMLREAIDAGMYANFPGGLIASNAARQKTNEIRVAPGSLAPIDIGGLGDINKAISMLPYKDVTPGLIALMQSLVERGTRLGGTADSPVGEGKQDAPVGTTLALIEQATKIEAGVHKGFHAAQAEEFRLFKDLFAEDPESLWQGNRRPAMGKDLTLRLEKFKRALADCELVPMSDPNVPSHMHRLMKANAVKQMTMGNAAYDQIAVDRRVFGMMQIDDFDSLLAPAPQGGPQPDPVAMAKLQIDKQNADTRAAEAQARAELGHAQIQSKEQIEAAKLGQAHAAGQQDPGQKVKESLSYKDAPPDIQRQIERQAGLVPSQIPMANGGGVEPPDPLQEQALTLKARQVQQSEQKMHLDFANAHAERESKAHLKGLDIAARLATHPESQTEVNSEIAALQPEMRAPQTMGAGGTIGTPMDAEQHKAIYLALEIAKALQERRNSGSYVN